MNDARVLSAAAGWHEDIQHRPGGFVLADMIRFVWPLTDGIPDDRRPGATITITVRDGAGAVCFEMVGSPELIERLEHLWGDPEVAAPGLPAGEER